MQNNRDKTHQFYLKKLKKVQKSFIDDGGNVWVMRQYKFILTFDLNQSIILRNIKKLIVFSFLVAFSVICANFLTSLIAVRCLLPSNYLVWEATRPLADCSYCENVIGPLVLRNMTRKKFQKYTYSAKPIIVKHAIMDWKAKELTFDTFRTLYEETPGSYESLEEGCQFLNFKTDLFSLKEVFDMPRARVNNEEGQQPWYVGWGNCHPDILSKLRQYYSVPEFLPIDVEYPATENIFIGYDMGAVMHLDYISRLMWQGQVKGNKTWKVAPVPECDHVCHSFEYYVEPGDVVMLDTRIWYHSTSIQKGQFSLTVQSEYG